MPDPMPVNEATLLDKVWTILRKISESLASSSQFTQITHRIVGIIAEGLNVDDCTMYQLDPATNELVLIASHALTIPAGERVAFPSDKGLIGQAFQLQQTLNVANHLFHPKFILNTKIGEENFHSCLVSPLSWNGKNLGVLVLQSKSCELFSDTIVDMLRSLSPQLANLFINAEIFQQTLNSEPHEDIEEASTKISMLTGEMVSRGVAAGHAYRVKTSANFSDITIETTPHVKHELDLLSEALVTTKKDILELEQCALNLLTEVDASIFTTHLLMLDDHLLIKHLRDNIETQNYTLISSIKETYFFFEKKFLSINDKMFRERLSDLKDILLRLLECVQRIQDQKSNDHAHQPKLIKKRDIILVAEELLPSDLMRISIDAIRGIVCESGGSTSHVAILAKSLGIPAIMAVKGLMKSVSENDELLLDANANTLYLNPENELRIRYNDVMADQLEPTATMRNATQVPLNPQPAVLADKTIITLRANISLLNEMAKLRESQAEGIGLYRSEFMFMMRETPPSEQDQYNIYVKLLSNTDGNPLTIRLLDIGADKPVPCLNLPKEDNPALGLRGIRLLLQRQEDVLIPHLRAILRAAAHGKIRILIPMVASVHEVIEVKKLMETIKAKLYSQNINYGHNIQLGVMLETPSLLFEMNQVLKEVNFLSVGSNDLIQYLFAADRGNANLNYLTHPLNPTFFGVLKWIVEICRRNSVSPSICGEIAGLIQVAPILVGIGFTELSMAPKRATEIRKLLSKLSMRDCQDAANYACQMDKENIYTYMNNLIVRSGFNND